MFASSRQRPQRRRMGRCAEAGCRTLPGEGLAHLFPGRRGVRQSRCLRVPRSRADQIRNTVGSQPHPARKDRPSADAPDWAAARAILEVETIDVVPDRGYFKIEDIEACEKAGMRIGRWRGQLRAALASRHRNEASPARTQHLRAASSTIGAWKMETRNGPSLMAAGACAVVQPSPEVVDRLNVCQVHARVLGTLESDLDFFVGDDLL